MNYSTMIYLLVKDLKASWSGKDWRADCPACGYKASLSLSKGRNGQMLWYCHAGCSGNDVLIAIRELGFTDNTANYGNESPSHAASENRSIEMSRIAQQLWAQGLSAQGTPVEEYLHYRCLDGPIPATIAYLQDQLHRESGIRLPVMMAAVSRWPNRKVVAIHRTYLSPHEPGKAAVVPSKKTLGPIGGGAVRLAATGPILAIAEGIETALSVQQVTGIPTWSALSAGNLRKVVLPNLPLAKEIIICADADPVGLAMAKKAAVHIHSQGRQVRIAVPLKIGTDFNDQLREGQGI